MRKILIAQIIAGISIGVGLAVMIGWYFDINILTSINPEWTRMKVATAICFVLSGIIVYFLTLLNGEKVMIKRSALIIISSFMTIIMVMIFLGSIFGFNTGLENIAYIDIHETNALIFQGRPSVATTIAFILISYIGILSGINSSISKSSCAIGLIIGTIGTTGVVGYLVNEPTLYYEIAGFSNAIAMHTAVLFVLLGAAIFLVWQENWNANKYRNTK